MKTTIKQIATGTFIALLFMVVNVNATETKTSSHEANETNLRIEYWMTDETVWDVKSYNVADFAKEAEASLELENWMTNSETWNLSLDFIEATEENLELEDWMTIDDIWNVNNINEYALVLEAWMTDLDIWK